MNSIKSVLFAAMLGYKATIHPLKFKEFIISAMLTPLFTMLFYVSVKYVSYPSAMQKEGLVTVFLIIPAFTCIYYISRSINDDKYYGTVDILAISPTGLFMTKLLVQLFTLLEVVMVSVFWLVTLNYGLLASAFSFTDVLNLTYILVCASLSLVFFGLLLALSFSLLEDGLIVVNLAFTLVVILSTLTFDGEYSKLVTAVLPLNYFVEIAKGDLSQLPYGEIASISGIKSAVYLLLARVVYQAKRWILAE
ncbi:hypothetical protein VITU102760_15030 [Vibrio tubiashii]|uniref:ABC transporter n=1 Tax=Vibrio tubiashii ATCC 19109 TaxID=1051646 RepID=F9T4E5_9VIBR|nr:hypothetical protein [Vibrio tubiashii]AIW13329.1 ABC transporter [Vibrio tubiashii ATCC 19109]EGU56056.1 hypothetical protein VITU9109_08847 [Vibrio tubiashii ATCC 19109]EIF04465.1 ABC transporter [Vibrio tubiashii NCIMB 1337 = ATCC 19106]